MLKKPVMITGLHEILSQDYSIEELYWGTCFGESCRPGRFLVLNSFCSSWLRGVARGGPGVPVTPLGRPSFEQTTYNIQVAKTPWQYLGRKSHCWKAHFFKICFFVKYFRQRLLSLVNMGLHAAIIRLSPLIHEGEQRVSSLCDPPFEKSWLRPWWLTSCKGLITNSLPVIQHFKVFRKHSFLRFFFVPAGQAAASLWQASFVPKHVAPEKKLFCDKFTSTVFAWVIPG